MDEAHGVTMHPDDLDATSRRVTSGLYDNAIFAGLDREAIEAIAGNVTPLELAAGEILFREGDRGSCLYLVLSGVIQVFATRGATDVSISAFSAGSYFGELALLGQEIRSASARAMEPAVLLPIDQATFGTMIEQYPVISTNIGRRLVSQLVTTTQSMVHQERGEIVLVVVSRLPELRNFVEYICEAVAAMSGDGIAVMAPRSCLSHSTSLLSAVRSNQRPVNPDRDEQTAPTYFAYRAGSLMSASAISNAIGEMSDYFRRWWKRTLIFIGDQEQEWYTFALPRADRAFVICPPEELEWWQPETLSAHTSEALPPMEAVPMIGHRSERRQAGLLVERAGFSRPLVFLPQHAALESLTAGHFSRHHLTDLASARQKDVMRFARALAKTRIGVSFGAGGARGMAHIGTLRYLEEMGIPIDAISGTSIGAMIGGVAAKGDTSFQAEAFMHHWMDTGYKKLMRPALSRHSILSGKVIADTCRELFGELEFIDIDTPLAVVGADLVTGKGAVLKTGQIAPAVHASMSIPGMFPPVIIGPHVLVDGGVCDPVPTGVLPALGADLKIVINISFTAEDLDLWMAEEGIAAPARAIREGKAPNVIDTYLAAFSIAVSERASNSGASADVYIRPRFLVTSWREFSQGPEHMRRGYAAAERVAGQLRDKIPWLTST
jgi:NTE family protein